MSTGTHVDVMVIGHSLFAQVSAALLAHAGKRVYWCTDGAPRLPPSPPFVPGALRTLQPLLEQLGLRHDLKAALGPQTALSLVDDPDGRHTVRRDEAASAVLGLHLAPDAAAAVLEAGHVEDLEPQAWADACASLHETGFFAGRRAKKRHDVSDADGIFARAARAYRDTAFSAAAPQLATAWHPTAPAAAQAAAAQVLAKGTLRDAEGRALHAALGALLDGVLSKKQAKRDDDRVVGFEAGRGALQTALLASGSRVHAAVFVDATADRSLTARLPSGGAQKKRAKADADVPECGTAVWAWADLDTDALSPHHQPDAVVLNPSGPAASWTHHAPAPRASSKAPARRVHLCTTTPDALSEPPDATDHGENLPALLRHAAAALGLAGDIDWRSARLPVFARGKGNRVGGNALVAGYKNLARVGADTVPEQPAALGLRACESVATWARLRLGDELPR